MRDNPDSRIIPDADSVAIGPYTAEIRDHYIAYRLGKYLIDHPEVDIAKARKYARVAWHRKVKGWTANKPENSHVETKPR